MPIAIVGLLLCSALLHAGWNLLVKRAGEKLVFTWWALIVGWIGFGPVLLFAPRLPLRVWPYILFSTIFEVAYFYTLTRAYDHGDFSLVYPIARGTAPGLLAVWSALFSVKYPVPVASQGWRSCCAASSLSGAAHSGCGGSDKRSVQAGSPPRS